MTFQAGASRQGRQFEDQCNAAILDVGFEQLCGRQLLSGLGVEVDQLAVSPNGTWVWFEYKGSLRGKRPGLIRTDTVKKAVCNGALLKGDDPGRIYVILSSHLPATGASRAMLDAALRLGYVDLVVNIYEPGWESRLLTL